MLSSHIVLSFPPISRLLSLMSLPTKRTTLPLKPVCRTIDTGPAMLAPCIKNAIAMLLLPVT